MVVTRRRSVLLALGTVGVVAGVVGLGWWLLHRPTWTRMLWVQLGTDEGLEYGYERTWRFRWGSSPPMPIPGVSMRPVPFVGWAESRRWYALVWHRSDGVRRYLVYAGDSDRSQVDLRASEDMTSLWLHDRERDRILCSLERPSEQFLNESGLPQDWRLSLTQQLGFWSRRELAGQFRSHPKTAIEDPAGGVLLASANPGP